MSNKPDARDGLQPREIRNAPAGFAGAFFHHPDELKVELADAGRRPWTVREAPDTGNGELACEEHDQPT